MRIIKSIKETTSMKQTLFRDLVQECQRSTPESSLSEKIKKKIGEIGKAELKDVVAQTEEGCAPLFLACKNGSAEVVEYLLSTCCADIEQRGKFEVAEEAVSHSVTPLWCAAVAGRLSVVKVLLRFGADVNAASDSGSTPIRSACYIVRPGVQTSHFDIVKCLVKAGADLSASNHFGGTCLINSVQSPTLVALLLETKNIEVNAQDIQRKTALHYAVQENRVESAKLLLGAGADPMMLSKYGDDVLQTACLKGSLNIFNNLLETVFYDPNRIADAFELIGTTFLLDFHDIGSTLFFWRKALEIRYEGDFRHYPKVVDHDTVHPVLGFREFDSKTEIDEFHGDPKCMKIQALLITERVLGQGHKDTIFRYMYAGAAHADSNDYTDCVSLWNYALKLKMEKETLLSCDTAFTARAIVQLYVNILIRHMTNPNPFESEPPLKFDDILTTSGYIRAGIDTAMELLKVKPTCQKQLDSFDIILTTWIHLVHILLQLAETEFQKTATFEEVMPMLQKNVKTHKTGDSLLHLAVSSASTLHSNSFLDGDGETSSNLTVFPSPKVTEFILKCGYDIHSRNSINETPLHIAVKPENFSVDIATQLLEHGAHLDIPDSRDICPVDILKAQKQTQINLVPYVSLQCLAAQVIVKERVPFTSQDVPRHLDEMLQMHLPNRPALSELTLEFQEFSLDDIMNDL